MIRLKWYIYRPSKYHSLCRIFFGTPCIKLEEKVRRYQVDVLRLHQKDQTEPFILEEPEPCFGPLCKVIPHLGLWGHSEHSLAPGVRLGKVHRKEDNGHHLHA